MDLRRRDRDEAGAAVGQANEAVAKIDDELSQIESERQSIRQNLATNAGAARPQVDRLLANGRYDAQLQIDKHSLLETRGKLLQEVERRTQRLREAQSEVKRLEILRDKARQGHDQEMLRREQIEIDEAASRRYAGRVSLHGDDDS